MASRSGASLRLVWLLRWLKQHESTIEPAVVLRSDGPLRPEFEALAPTVAWSQPLFRPLMERLGTRLLGGGTPSPAALLEAAVERHKPDLIYINTLVLGRHLQGLSANPGRPPFLSHVHELETALATMSTPEDVARQLAQSSHVIACAEGVRRSLHETFGLPPERCTMIPEFIPLSRPERHDGAAARETTPAGGIRAMRCWQGLRPRWRKGASCSASPARRSPVRDSIFS
jgi:hypothetical protein